jgi:hypothetical protein
VIKPKRLFRARRRPADVFVVEINHGPGKPLASVQAFVAQHRHTFKPGVHHVVTMHDSHCKYPGGGRCTCIHGPECKIVGLDPAAN